MRINVNKVGINICSFSLNCLKSSILLELLRYIMYKVLALKALPHDEISNSTSFETVVV